MRRYLAQSLSILCLLTLALGLAAPTAAATLSEAEGAALIAALRQDRGLAPLAVSAPGGLVARRLASDMARSHRAWVFAPDGGSPWRRLGLASPDPRLVGVLTMQGYDGWPQVLANWLSRPDTKAILLDPKARTLGIGSITDASGCHWIALWLFR